MIRVFLLGAASGKRIINRLVSAASRQAGAGLLFRRCSMKSFFSLLAMMTLMLTGLSASTLAAASDETVKIGVVGFCDSLEPTEQYFSWVVTRYAVGETLVRFDEQMNIQPWLAESWTLADDKLTWTFKIRAGVKFSNGNPMTAEAVKNSLERTFAMSKRASANFFEYDFIRAEGNSLIIKSKKPAPMLAGCLADPLFLIVDTGVDTTKFATEGPICTGPYAVESFSRGLTVVRKNEHYWDGEVPYQEVTIQTIDDTNTRTMALQGGEIAFAVNIAASDVALFRDQPDFTVDEIASLRSVLSFMNQHGPLKDLKLRQAVIRALNREAYAKYLLHDTFAPGKAPVPPSLDYGFDDLIDPNAYDVASAKKLLAEAGYEDVDGDGFVEGPDGQKLTLRHIIYNSRAELPILAEASQADLKKIGLNTKVESYDYTSLLDMQESGDYDLLIWNVITVNTGDPEHYLRELWKSHTEVNKNNNTADYSNPKVDELLDRLAVEFDLAERRQIIIDVQQLIINDAASIFFAYPETNIIYNNKMVRGVKMVPSDYYWLTKNIRPATK